MHLLSSDDTWVEGTKSEIWPADIARPDKEMLEAIWPLIAGCQEPIGRMAKSQI